MMINKKVETVQNGLVIAQERELRRLDQIYKDLKANNPRGVMFNFMAQDALYRGYYEFFSEKKIYGLKQWFYVSSLLRIKSCKYSGGYSMSTPDEFIFSLLSDSTQIIDKFSCLDTVNLLWGQYEPSYQEAKFKPSKDDPRYRTHALQAVLRNDWKDYQEIKALANQKINKLREVVQFEFGIYDAIYERDKDKIIEIVQTLLKPKVHKAYNKDFSEEFNGDIWSHHPVMFTKLAWMNGLEIEIDNPLVPMELMPVKPLDHYDYHYDFLDPNWKPKSFWGRLLGRK